MKRAFFISKPKIYTCLLVIGALLFFTSCINKQKDPPKPPFDLNTPGGEVQAFYNDTIPKVIFYYQVDEQGNTTDEKIGVADFHPNKKEYRSYGLKDERMEGKCYAFFEDGSVQCESFYIDGELYGEYNLFNENGTPKLKAHYDHGICDGTWIWYDENGKQTKKIKADKKTIACEYCKKCLALKIKN